MGAVIAGNCDAGGLPTITINCLRWPSKSSVSSAVPCVPGIVSGSAMPCSPGLMTSVVDAATPKPAIAELLLVTVTCTGAGAGAPSSDTTSVGADATFGGAITCPRLGAAITEMPASGAVIAG